MRKRYKSKTSDKVSSNDWDDSEDAESPDKVSPVMIQSSMTVREVVH